MNVVDRIPARYRGAIYATLSTVYAVEVALDLVDWGVIPDDIQAKALLVLGSLGFALAKHNTTDIVVVREGDA